MIQRYIQMRNNQQYNIEWFYEYFMTEGGKMMPLLEFTQYFNLLNLNDILNYLDNKFKLTILINKNNNFIKIIE